MKFGKFIACAMLGLLALTQAFAQKQDLVDTALATQKFNLFMSLAGDAGIIFDLKNPGPFTLLIPTDTAINSKYTKSQLDALRANPTRLKEILMHHVLRGNIDAVTAVKMKTLHPLTGRPIMTSVVDGHGVIGGAHFVITNVSTTNGTIHGIDMVLVP